VTHWRALIEKDHLGAWDLQRKDWTLVISKVEMKKVFNQKTNSERGKCVITFKGAKKPLISNSTNCGTIENLYGDQYEKWIGKPVTLYATTCTVGRKTVDCIRIRNKVPTTAAAEIGPDAPVDQEMREKQDAAFDRGSDREPGEEG
jgi:hypothetical protein